MSEEQNKATARRGMEELINKKNLGVLDEICSAKVIDHSLPPGTPPGVEAARQMNSMFLSAFPDINITVEDMIAEGDKVATRYTFRGTHTGDFMGIAPTGKRIEVAGISIERFVEGKIAERWEIFDQMAMMQQLGVVPESGSPS